MKNVIFIISDQMRWDVLGCNGAEFMKTPNFDSLAGVGVNFSCAYSGNPVCVPARGILATGCYSHNCMDPAAGNRNAGEILPEHTHIAEHFRNNGYATFGIGKAHCLPYKKNPGFDVFEVAEEGRIEFFKESGEELDPVFGGGITDANIKEDYLEYLRDKGLYGMQRAHGIGNNDARGGAAALPIEHYVDTWATTRSLELLKNHVSKNVGFGYPVGKPFFLQLGFVKPHAPYDPPQPYDRMYDPLKIPKPWGGPEDLKGRNPFMPLERSSHLIDKMSEAAIQYSRAHYFGLVSYLDSQVGRVIKFLDENNLRDDTLIVFTADHGDNLGDHGVFFKTVFTEGSAHIPLIFSLPGEISANICDTPVGQEDIMPTVCELAGVEIPDGVDGTSLAKLMKDPSAKHKPFVISQYDSGEALTLMIRDERYKYCFCRYESTEELYDIEADPYEIKNLISEADFKDTLVQMRNTADRWCRQNNHEPILTGFPFCDESQNGALDDGKLTYSKFIASRHSHWPSQVLGIRPY